MSDPRHVEGRNGHQVEVVCGKGVAVGPEEGDRHRQREHVLDHVHQHQMLAADSHHNGQCSVLRESRVSCIVQKDVL